MNRSLTRWLYIQTALILAGATFAWATLLTRFTAFYDIYGTVFRVKNCIIPNPMITPCFYGAVAFVVALIWSILLTIHYSSRSHLWLRRFLLFGVLFALTVVSIEFAQYYEILGGPAIGCTPGVYPTGSPCFVGLIFFVLAWSSSLVVHTKTNENVSH